MGCWDQDRCFGMEYVKDKTLLAAVPFDAATGNLVNFKFLVRQDGDQPLLENLTTRKLVLPENGRIAVDCFWGQLS